LILVNVNVNVNLMNRLSVAAAEAVAAVTTQDSSYQDASLGLLEKFAFDERTVEVLQFYNFKIKTIFHSYIILCLFYII